MASAERVRTGAEVRLQDLTKTFGAVVAVADVSLTIPAGSPMASVMTLESIDDLSIKKGDKVRVIVKAIHVLLIKE